MDLQFRQAIQQGNAEWMAAAQAALKRNKSTLAVVYVAFGRAHSHIARAPNSSLQRSGTHKVLGR
jgi:hypothetical protein